jgi:hypothetical protein
MVNYETVEELPLQPTQKAHGLAELINIHSIKKKHNKIIT